MIKVNRLNTLKLQKSKNLNKVSLEINTLNNEIKKSNDLRNKLINIKEKSNLEVDYNNSWSIKHKHDFDIKIIQQVSFCQNRVSFLEKELKIAKSKLGSLIVQKKHIEEKIKSLFAANEKKIEEKQLRDNPNFKKN